MALFRADVLVFQSSFEKSVAARRFNNRPVQHRGKGFDLAAIAEKGPVGVAETAAGALIGARRNARRQNRVSVGKVLAFDRFYEVFLELCSSAKRDALVELYGEKAFDETRTPVVIPEVLVLWIKYLFERGYALNTIRNNVSAIRSTARVYAPAFRFDPYQLGLINSTIAAIEKNTPTAEVTPNTKTVVPPAAAAMIVAKLGWERYRHVTIGDAIVLCIGLGGQRPSTLCGIKLKHITYAAGGFLFGFPFLPSPPSTLPPIFLVSLLFCLIAHL